MKTKAILLLGFAALGLTACETSDTCQCEVYRKIYDENGQVVSLDYIGPREGHCNDLTDRDDVDYSYQSVNCN